ncbi:MAG: hypothetical protein AAGF20_03665 [Pseudomonadota bacterium]
MGEQSMGMVAMTGVKRSANGASSGYEIGTLRPLRRILFACFLCGIAACMVVTLIGVVLIFGVYQIGEALGIRTERLFSDNGFLEGMSYAAVMAALNWFIGYLTIPAAWVALFFSIGRFPKRGITAPGPYNRWAMIWGALLVGGTCTIVCLFIGGANITEAAGALVTGGAIGMVAGFVCGAIFRGIVRPSEQGATPQIDVF